MRSVKLTLAYDGAAYAGWQVQPGHRTVQGVLEVALARITGQPASTLASGRTDAGVHALGQVVCARIETHLSNDILQRALNAELPKDVAVLRVHDAPDAFHPIRDVVRKHYRYVLHDGPVRDVFSRDYCWQVRARLDAEAMHRAAQALCGKHDFSSFESAGAERESSVRTVFEISVQRGQGDRADFITFNIQADGFLYNMVRAIVGTLVEVGRRAQPESWVGEVLRATNRSAAGPTAPPQGLFLVAVEYPCESHTSSRD